MPHTIALVMQDHPGVLHRTVSLLRRRGYNIESLAVGRSETAGVSRMTLVVEADDVEQVTKQLDRLVEVLAVHDVTHHPTTERETALVKVHATGPGLAAVLSALEGHAARVADRDAAGLVIEVTDAPALVERFIERMRPFGIRELARTGRIALARGPTAAATWDDAQADGDRAAC
jgi:acetolactate synthase-1/3 small subunit